MRPGSLGNIKSMDKKLIILPDTDFITELAEGFKNEDPKPAMLYVDGHVDLPYFMAGHARDKVFDNLETGPVTPETVKKSGVRLFATAIHCRDIYNDQMAFKHFERNYDFTKKILENVVRIKNKNDLSEIKEKIEAIGTLFLLENADVLANNIPLSLSLRDRGIFIVGLTGTGKNRLADGEAVIHSDGITPSCREVIKILKDNNILIDVASLHPSCFWQLMDLVETPCVSSHTGVKERCNIPGNLDLSQIKQISDRGGLAAITFNPERLSSSGEADIEDIFIHIDTIVQKFGPDSVALGSGFCGFDTFARGMEDLTGVEKLRKHMKAQGYGENAIEKIMGLNWIRIYTGLL